MVDDLRGLRLLKDTGHYSGPQFHRTRVRQMNLAVFLAVPTTDEIQKLFEEDLAEDAERTNIQESIIANQESNIESGAQSPGVQHSKQESNIQEQESNIASQESKIGGFLDTTVTVPTQSDRHTHQGRSLRSLARELQTDFDPAETIDRSQSIRLRQHA